MSCARTPIRVLVLCTANSARSQIAEALLRHYGRGRVEAASAGARPADRVHPAALGVLAAHGVPVSGRGPRASGDLLAAMGEIAVRLGEESCPGGFRVLSNFGSDGLQTQPHGHLHVVGGAPLGLYIRPRGPYPH